MGISEDLAAALCRKPCKGPITWGQRRLLPDGTVEVSGERPPPLCDACPERNNPEVRHIEVRYGFPPGGDIWEVVDESAAREDAGRVVIRVEYDDPPESESVADAGASARRPMVNGPEPDPAPRDLAEADAVPGEAAEEATDDVPEDLADPLPRPKPPKRRRTRNREGPVFRPEDFGLSPEDFGLSL